MYASWVPHPRAPPSIFSRLMRESLPDAAACMLTYCMLLTFHYPSTMNVYCKVVLVLVVMVMVVVIRAVWC